MLSDLPFTLSALRQAYTDGVPPEAVITEAFARLDRIGDPGIFLHIDRDGALAAARALGPKDGKPLWGIPFAVKDNIDVAGLPTTAACPDFAYTAQQDAFTVARLKEAGAICLGKTNLDQFATGLVGVRTPYPVPLNALDPAIVPGGSSSGSGVTVGHGIATFSLGTDTAGSGRVPAALNGIVGLKPSLGAYSATGVVPACRTLDTISIFALTVSDAFAVHTVASGFDAADGYSRPLPTPQTVAPLVAPRIAVPDDATLTRFGTPEDVAAFHSALDALRHHGAQIRAIDVTPFLDCAQLLYGGAWVAERTAAIGARLLDKPETLHPTTRAIVEPGLKLSAVDAFNGLYRLADLRRACETAMHGFDMLCVPTIPRFVTVAEITADPITPNSLLGTYTNFVNLIDLCGLAVPTGRRPDGRPGSVTLLARWGKDPLLAATAQQIESGPMGATPWPRPQPTPAPEGPAADEMALVVCGAHMSGLPLNHQLGTRGARFLKACNTAPDYGFYALAGGPPARPGLVRRTDGTGAAIAVEVWAIPQAHVGSFLAGIPAPLGLGSVVLEDGTTCHGFICEGHVTATATDITSYGGWRNYVARAAETAAG